MAANTSIRFVSNYFPHGLLSVQRRIALCVMSLVLAACSVPAPVDRTNLLPDEKSVLDYMRTKHPSERQRLKVAAALGQCQAVSVLFLKDAPSDPHDQRMFDLDLKWHVQGYSQMEGTHEVAHRMAVVWSVADGSRTGHGVTDWLSDFSDQAKYGYTAVDAMILANPAEATVSNTLKLCEEALNNIERGLEERKAKNTLNSSSWIRRASTRGRAAEVLPRFRGRGRVRRRRT